MLSERLVPSATTLLVARFNPMMGVGMAMAGIGSKLIPPLKTALEQDVEAAGPQCTPQ
jgi:hypothetical protein